MLRFLARGSAGTDGSFIGSARRGLALSRRNQRRTEERRNDKSRDRKFGSHQKCLRRVTGSLQTSGGDLVPARDKHCASFIFKKKPFAIAAQTSVTFRTQDLRKAPPMVRMLHAANLERDDLIRGMRNIRGEYQVSSLLKMRRSDVRCGSSSLKDRISICRLSNVRNAWSPKSRRCRSPAE